LGIGDWGLGDWGLGAIPNPQSPIPIPMLFYPFKKNYIIDYLYFLKIINNYLFFKYG